MFLISISLKYPQLRKKYIFKNYKLRFNTFAKPSSFTFIIFLQYAAVLTSRKLIRFILLLKWATRKRDQTFRYFWFRAAALVPLTRHVQNSRMGKGGGKFRVWVSIVHGGIVFFEVARMRWGRFKFFSKQIIARFAPHVIRFDMMPIDRNLFF